MNIFGITFLEPLLLLGIFVVPVFLYVLHMLERKNTPQFATAKQIQQIFGMGRLVFACKYIGLFVILSLFFVLFADPNLELSSEDVKKNGIDIVIVFDVSESMLAEDMQPNRLEEAKKVVNRFIEKQETNRVGLVLFSGRPFTSIPLTFDYNILTETVDRLTPEMIQYGGTAIGDALLAAKNTFDQSKIEDENEQKREKVVILLTDGDSNTSVPPETAVVRLKDENIKMYAVGIGSEAGGSFVKQMGPFSQRIPLPPLDDKRLKSLAQATNGEFFRATDTATFRKIFTKLERLEKNDVTVTVEKNYTDLYDEISIVLVIILFVYLLLVGGFPYILRS